jgi:hypothetical protein
MSIFKGSLGDDDQWGLEITDLKEQDPLRLKEKLETEVKQITKSYVFT